MPFLTWGKQQQILKPSKETPLTRHADRASSDDGRSFDDPEIPLPEQGKNAAITTIPWTLVLSNRIHLSAWSQCLAAHCWQSSAAS